MELTADDPNDYYDFEKTATALVAKFVSKSNGKALREFCEANDLEIDSDKSSLTDIKELRETVLRLIEEEIGYFETAKTLSEEFISNVFLSSDSQAIEKLCKKYKLPKQFNRNLEDIGVVEAQNFLSQVFSHLREETDIYSIASDLIPKYLFPIPPNKKPSTKIIRTTWDDVGDYLSEQELASLIGCSVKTLRNNRSLRKGFTYVEMGGSIKYPKKELLEYLESKTIRMDYQ